MILTIDYEEFENLVKRITNVLKQDKKLTIESKVFTIALPDTKGETLLDKTLHVYTRTKTIQLKMNLKVLSYKSEVDQTSLSQSTDAESSMNYLELASKQIEELLATFNAVETKPYQIRFEYQPGSYAVNSILSTKQSLLGYGDEPEQFTFKFAYTPPSPNMITEINKSIEAADTKYSKQEIKTTDLELALLGLLNVQKTTDSSMQKEFFVNFTDKYVFGRTSATLSLYHNRTGLSGIKLRLDSVALLYLLVKTTNRTFGTEDSKVADKLKVPAQEDLDSIDLSYSLDSDRLTTTNVETDAEKQVPTESVLSILNDKLKCNLVIKTDYGTYVMNYLTNLEGYETELKLTSVRESITVNKQDFLTKIKRLKLVNSKVEVALVSNSTYKTNLMMLLSREMTQSIAFTQPKGELFKALNFNLVQSVFEELCQVIQTTDAQVLNIYFGKTDRDAWILGFRDETSKWYTLTGIRTLKDLSQKTDEYSRIVRRFGGRY